MLTTKLNFSQSTIINNLNKVIDYFNSLDSNPIKQEHLNLDGVCFGIIETWSRSSKSQLDDKFKELYEWCANENNIEALTNNAKTKYNIHEVLSFAEKLRFNQDIQIYLHQYQQLSPHLPSVAIRKAKAHILNCNKSELIQLLTENLNNIDEILMTLTFYGGMYNYLESSKHSFAHIVGFKKKDTNYEFFDPCNPEGIVAVNTIEDLVEEIFAAKDRQFPKIKLDWPFNWIHAIQNRFETENTNHIDAVIAQVAKDDSFIETICNLQLAIKDKEKFSMLNYYLESFFLEYDFNRHNDQMFAKILMFLIETLELKGDIEELKLGQNLLQAIVATANTQPLFGYNEDIQEYFDILKQKAISSYARVLKMSPSPGSNPPNNYIDDSESSSRELPEEQYSIQETQDSDIQDTWQAGVENPSNETPHADVLTQFGHSFSKR